MTFVEFDPSTEDTTRAFMAAADPCCVDGAIPFLALQQPALLPFWSRMILLELDSEADDFRYTFFGSTLAFQYKELTGKTLGEVDLGIDMDMFRTWHRQIMTDRTARAITGRMQDKIAKYWTLYQVTYPLLRKDRITGTVTHIIRAHD